MAAFDALAARMVARMPLLAANDHSVSEVLHDPSQQQVLRFLKLRQSLNLRGRLAQLGAGDARYFDRLAYLCASDMVVLNPAGEFQSTACDTALHYLLEARCAQLSGAATAFVNLSFYVNDPVLALLSDHVFRNCCLTKFRDAESLTHLRATGGTASPVILPDAAILSKINRPAKRGGRGLALAINALQVRDHGLSDQWDHMFPKLLGSGPITLTSNQWTTDYPFWQQYLKRSNVDCEGQNLPYDEYAQLLGSFDVVVSSRLHTCVLGLLAGAVIIPVESGTFKLTGFFSEIGMPSDPIRMGVDSWEDAVIERVNKAFDNKAELVSRQDAHVSSARSRLETELMRILPDLKRSQRVH